MTVARINPSAIYVQDELSRIQSNLANAVDNTANTNTQLLDAGYYWSENYPGGVVESLRTIYNPTNNTTTITQWFQFPVSTTILNVSMLHNNTVTTRSDLFIYSGTTQLFAALGIIAPNTLYGNVASKLVIAANTQFNVAYSFPSSGLNLACYSYLNIQLGS